MGQQGISEDAYGLTIALRKRLESMSLIPFSWMRDIGIGAQGFQDIWGSRSCTDAGTRQIPTLVSGILPVTIVGLQGRGHRYWHGRDGNSRAPNKSWYQNVVSNQVEESRVRLRVWLWKATDGISKLFSYRGTGTLLVIRRSSPGSRYGVGYRKPRMRFQGPYWLRYQVMVGTHAM